MLRALAGYYETVEVVRGSCLNHRSGALQSYFCTFRRDFSSLLRISGLPVFDIMLTGFVIHVKEKLIRIKFFDADTKLLLGYFEIASLQTVLKMCSHGLQQLHDLRFVRQHAKSTVKQIMI